MCIVCHTNRKEGGERICIRFDSRLDTAYFGLIIADVTQRSFAWRQTWRRDLSALYIEHLLERRDPLRLSRALYISFASWLKSTFWWYTHPTFLSSACFANLTVLLWIPWQFHMSKNFMNGTYSCCNVCRTPRIFGAFTKCIVQNFEYTIETVTIFEIATNICSQKM